ncbi:MerR family DNA-binding transcriptional regulator [Aquabacterium sp.]|uniref:MerR family DNA-binding transcriptional regulator n=1 Tax=Aquabacterium sp. TaxID=1872578 RepID=UPI002BA38A7B|nr:MerR family DNA-binding transcriptional regulator [Aquabacterium sp.]HSW08230.1 MerR family DNA-binding transcriptional regulator [Aquabacterium sp.]
MKISELARRTGVSVHRLRRYEAQGLIRAERLDSGYREFAEVCVREVTFLGMGREIGLSLKVLGDALPRYRAGTLSIDEMIETLQSRIAEIDALVAEQRALRRKLVSHIAWFRRRQARPARPASGARGFPASVSATAALAAAKARRSAR